MSALRGFLLLVVWIIAAPFSNKNCLPAQDGRERVPETVQELQFGETGYTNYGDWQATVAARPYSWKPGAVVRIDAVLSVTENHLRLLSEAGIRADGFCLLATAERTFDADGRLRLASDEKMSTLLTPTGLAIEGGVQGAVTNRFGYGFRTPVDEFEVVPLAASETISSQRQSTFRVHAGLPNDLPPGIYRLRLDFGVTEGKRYYSLNGEAFAYRPFFNGRPTESHLYSPPIGASGKHVSGRDVDASRIRPRIPWVLLANYNSNGYRGVVADEDRPFFALSGRNLIQDDVIIPRYDDAGNKLAYSLEPQFPADTIEARSAIPWTYNMGELSVQITNPDGTVVNLGTAQYAGNSGVWPTTKYAPFTSWRPPAYGYYTLKATGWTVDRWGNRYEGGGTYHFWVAKRMTLATATFQGFSFPVGSRYGRDIAFAPAVPADVDVTATLYPDSDPAKARTIVFSGKASPSGIFGAAQGNKTLALDAPGEYCAQILARYWDRDGHFWVSTMRHAGVVYPIDSPVVARGKKLTIGGKYFERGETRTEGYVDPQTGTSHLQHVNFPFQSGDVLLIASDQQGANKIEPVLTYELKVNPAPYDPNLQKIGATNLRLRTSNGYSPHLFPEYVTDWAYYYAAAPRPGFMGRFLVAEDGTRAPYWPTSPNSFGGQINASNNGDLPGDIYRLLGGVVLRRKDQAPVYAGYLSSAFLLPRNTKNNRVIAPGAEDLTGSDGTRARFFLVGTRPGMVYERGASFAPAAQIDPVLPVLVTFVLTWPDGRQTVAQAKADSFGTFVGPERWTLDQPGIYRFQIEGDWDGNRGYMPGLPPQGGEIYVLETEKPANAKGLTLELPPQSTFSLSTGLAIRGTSTARTVHYAAVMPGAVIAQGDLPVSGGKFEYLFNPALVSNDTPTYDVQNMVSGKPEIADVVHLTFFAQEKTGDGVTYHSFVRVIIRGNRVFYTR
jgi:hypothetical protein